MTIRDLVDKMTEPPTNENFEGDSLLPRFPICFECFAGKEFSQSGIIQRLDAKDKVQKVMIKALNEEIEKLPDCDTDAEDLAAMEAKLAELEAQEAGVDKEILNVKTATEQELGKVCDFDKS